MKRKKCSLKHSFVWIWGAGGLAMAAVLISCAAQSSPSNSQNAAVLSLLDSAGSSGSKTDTMNAQSSTSMKLTRLDLNLSVGPSVTGDVFVVINNDPSFTSQWVTSVPAASLKMGTRGWYTFTFPVAPVLVPGEKYRMTIFRTVEHDYGGGNYIFWHSSPWGVDAYPDGFSVFDKNTDFSFVVYADGVVNQQSMDFRYGFATGTTPLWQEFKVAAPPPPVPPPPRPKVCPRYKIDCTDWDY